jgi:uncharacterized membrane protein YdbT with pleckstrin-like domain
MSYISKNLMTNEQVIFQTRLSNLAYLSPVSMVIVSLFFIKSIPAIGGFLFVLGLVLIISTFLKIKSSEFVVTDKRVLIKVGILSTQSLETLLTKVEGIHVGQGLIGKIVNSGSIIVKGTGGTNNVFKQIDKPFEFRSAVNEQIANLK